MLIFFADYFFFFFIFFFHLSPPRSFMTLFCRWWYATAFDAPFSIAIAMILPEPFHFFSPSFLFCQARGASDFDACFCRPWRFFAILSPDLPRVYDFRVAWWWYFSLLCLFSFLLLPSFYFDDGATIFLSWFVTWFRFFATSPTFDYATIIFDVFHFLVFFVFRHDYFACRRLMPDFAVAADFCHFLSPLRHARCWLFRYYAHRYAYDALIRFFAFFFFDAFIAR